MAHLSSAGMQHVTFTHKRKIPQGTVTEKGRENVCIKRKKKLSIVSCGWVIFWKMSLTFYFIFSVLWMCFATVKDLHYVFSSTHCRIFHVLHTLHSMMHVSSNRIMDIITPTKLQTHVSVSSYKWFFLRIQLKRSGSQTRPNHHAKNVLNLMASPQLPQTTLKFESLQA